MLTLLERVRRRLARQANRLARLEVALPEPAHGAFEPLVVLLRRRGDPTWDQETECREPGIYREGGGAEIVFDGDEPPSDWVTRFKPANGACPLFIGFGPQVIEPPVEPL